MSDYRLKIGNLVPTGVGLLKILGRRVAPTNHSFFRKTRLNDLSYDIKIWADLSTIFSQSTRVTDRQTDRQTEFSSLDRVCITCSAVKKTLRLCHHCNDEFQTQCSTALRFVRTSLQFPTKLQKMNVGVVVVKTVTRN